MSSAGNFHPSPAAPRPGQVTAMISSTGNSKAPPGPILDDLLHGLSEAEMKVCAALTWFTLPVEIEHVAAIADLPEDQTALAITRLAGRTLVVISVGLHGCTLIPGVAELLRNINPAAVAQAGDRLEARAYALIMENGWINKHNRFAVLDAAWPAVAPAIPRFVAGDNDRLQHVCNALHNFLCRTERLDEWLTLFLDTESRALAAGDYDNAGWRACVAEFLHSQRGATPDVLLACAVRAVSHWTAAYQQGDNQLGRLNHVAARLGGALNALGCHYSYSGDHPAAEVSFREALRLARSHENSEDIAVAACNLAWLALDRRDWPAAEDFAREALDREALPRRTALRREDAIAWANHLLARALLRQGRPAEALPCTRRAAEIYTRLGQPDLAAARETLAECEAAAGET